MVMSLEKLIILNGTKVYQLEPKLFKKFFPNKVF